MNQPSPARGKMIALIIVSFLAMACLDHFTHYEMVLSAVYLVPVSLCAWNFGQKAVWSVSLASGIATWASDEIAGRSYAHFMIQYWNSAACFVVSLITGLILLRLKRTLSERERANRELRMALENLERSTQEIRKLQNSLQVVCAWTKQIKVGDRWMTPDEFLQTQLNLKLSHGMSPEAVEQFEKQVEAVIAKTGRAA